MMKNKILKSQKLDGVGYDIRGPVLTRAQELEAEGEKIIKLNIGNLGAFGFVPPIEIVQDIQRTLAEHVGYTDSKGLFTARKAVVQYTQSQGVLGVAVDDVYLGNGASELIALSLNVLLNDGDEVLIPAPDYPLWTAVTTLSGGTPIHYICDETNDWQPSLEDIQSKITKNTKAIVVINPNNPTGAVYSKELLEGIVRVARKHSLIVFADEVYDKILFDDAVHVPLATIATDVLTIVFGSISKNYRSCGFRGGWMYLAGDKSHATDYIEGLNMLSSMRLCSNTAGQLAIQTALGGYQSIHELTRGDGRIKKQRDVAFELLSAIPGVKVVLPKGALYMFVALDPKMYHIDDDQKFVLELLEEQKVLVVQGTGFNWVDNHHFRFVFLPHEADLRIAIGRIATFLENKRIAQNQKQGLPLQG
ncbi:MAG: hypothetical protein RI996_109 [Candidatus Parcubacteria bacterium]|jgi:alanine-synthesizing transaminase